MSTFRLALMRSQKAGIEKDHKALLETRYNLGKSAAAGVTMSGGKAVQGGVRVNLGRLCCGTHQGPPCLAGR